MLVFVNAFTNKTEATAKPTPGMPHERLAVIEQACREGRADDVADDMLAIVRDQPHPDCFLLPEPT